MNLLLDTHIFLWYTSEDARLDRDIRDRIRHTENRIWVSSISFWECLVKHSLGKLPLPDQPAQYLSMTRQRHGFEQLPLDEASVLRLEHLPSLHRDPFDRMLICQALEHDLVLVTVDDAILQYPVATLKTK